MSFSELSLAERARPRARSQGLLRTTPIQATPSRRCSKAATCWASRRPAPARPPPSCCRAAALVEANKRVLPTHAGAGPGPTRELASQIAENAKGYAKFSKLAVATVFGGTSLNKNRQDLSRGVDILVATPGRLIDLVEQGFLNLSMIEILVLDEADQMLDLGFIRAAPHREDDPAQAPDAVPRPPCPPRSAIWPTSSSTILRPSP
jgi:ATP-dependent RNA helicase RhlE